jgi:hypothetical protein
MSYKTIAGLVPTMSALALAGENVRVATSKKKKTTKDFIGLGVTNIVGLSLLKEQATLVGGL